MMVSSPADFGRLFRFAIVGCSNAVIGYLVFMALYHSQAFPAGVRTPVAQLASYAVGVSWAFMWNRAWVFRSRDNSAARIAAQSVRFAAVQATCLVLSVILVTLAIDLLHWPATLGWIAAMSAVTAVNYLAISMWVFPAPP